MVSSLIYITSKSGQSYKGFAEYIRAEVAPTHANQYPVHTEQNYLSGSQ